jgi:hypothetical protein
MQCARRIPSNRAGAYSVVSFETSRHPGRPRSMLCETSLQCVPAWLSILASPSNAHFTADGSGVGAQASEIHLANRVRQLLELAVVDGPAACSVPTGSAVAQTNAERTHRSFILSNLLIECGSLLSRVPSTRLHVHQSMQ